MAVDLHVHSVGTSGPAVVLLHGLNESLDGYRPVMAELQADFRVFALDLRGHGDSAWAESYGLADYATDVRAALLAHLGEPVLLAGHAIGGLVAAYLASRETGLIEALLLEDPPIFSARLDRLKETPYHDIFRFARELLRQHQAVGASQDAMDLIVSTFSAEDERGERVPLRELYGDDYVAGLAHDLHRSDPRTLDYVLDDRLYGDFEPDQDLRRIACPTLLLMGQSKLGNVIAPADLDRVERLIPDCTSIRWQGVGHELHALNPHDFAQALRAFANRALRPR